jgi:rod shape-determining protein MreC
MKFFKNKLAVTVIVLSVTFLGIIIFSSEKNANKVFSNGAGIALNPVQKLVYNIFDDIKSGMTFFYTFSDVKKENEELKKKNIELENKLIEYDNFKNENERLSKILEFKNQRSDYNYVGAHIIGKSGGSFLDGYIIDKGQKDGIEK